MPEVKNTFIQSKMNKDMDGRILPNGQYRDGQNVQISRSEGDDVGALETVLGNNYKTNFGLEDDNLVAIGKLEDDSTDSIYLFLTNYTDCSYDQLSNPTYDVDGVKCYIVKYDAINELGSVLVEGNFLNFSTTHLITGVNLLEDLLFWTDNRNQPRKINIIKATPGYYYNEDQITVSKYYPYEPISLLKENPFSVNPDVQPPFESSMLDTTSEYLPIHTAAKIIGVNSSGAIPRYIIVAGCYDNIKQNTPLSGESDGNLVTGVALSTSPVIVKSISVEYATSRTFIEIETPNQPTLADSVLDNLNVDDILYFQFLNPDYLPAWPGDPDYLKNRFVRFSYRFKFDDGEYSLAAPFTQIAFVPRQDGYFIGDKAENASVKTPLVGQESATFDTTVVDFMQNKITDINLRIIAPTHRNLKNAPAGFGSSKMPNYMNWDEVVDKLKVQEIDILYKEADSNKITILDTLTVNNFSSNNTKNLYYNYQSRKPWKTVSPNQTTWVDSKVPVKALSQEVAGNRIIYGNFVDKHSTPINLNYTLQIGEKPSIPEVEGGSPIPSNVFTSISNVRKEYQNHTLKQNRTYQVGIVLSDRYGRSSNVILSSIKIANQDPENFGSTIFHTYKNPEDEIIEDKYQVRYTNLQDPTTWPGDMLRITFENAIPRAKNNTGYPGVYSIDDGSLESAVINNTSPNPAFDISLAGCTYTVEITNGSGGVASISILVGATGEAIFNGIVDSGSGWTDGDNFTVSSWSFFLPPCNQPNPLPIIQGVVFTAKANPLGWYSYKIVIKQQQQEYYNVYLPGSLAGYPCEQNPDNNPPFNISTLTSVPPGVEKNVEQEFGQIPKLEYPDGQFRTTAHVVLFSDNINKVPRDLQELGPLQDEFRSGEELFIRVESILLDGGSGIDNTYSSKQYKPNVLGDKVIAIASMEKFKLGDLTTSPAFPIIPNLFYKGDTNPLIARIQTEDIFGIYKGESDNGCKAEYQRPPDSPDPANEAVVRNTKYGYGPTLAVAETKPVESLLDIFWETTTSGLIQQLNFDIENSDNTIPSGLTSVDITWSEADDFGALISNDFQAAGPTGNPLGSSVEVELVNVVDGINTPCTGKFKLNPIGSGEYNISISQSSLGGGEGFLCWEDDARNTYFFTFTLTDLSTGNITNFEATGFINNREPNDRGGVTESGSGLASNLKDWLKDTTCDPTINFATTSDPRSAQVVTLRSEQGGQKFGLSSTQRFNASGNKQETFLDQFLAPESNIPNAKVNFGKIKPSGDKFVFYDRQLDPGYPDGGNPGDLQDCGGSVKDASPDNRRGGASGFRSFGYFGLRNYYEGEAPYSPSGSFGKPDGWPENKTALFDLGGGDAALLCNPSLQLQYLYDVEQWEDTSGGSNTDATPPYNSLPYPNIHDQSKVVAPIYMGLKEGTKTDLVTIHPSCDLKQLNNPFYNWDGVFRVANGAYGSVQPAETFPIGGDSAGTFGEVEWSIPRMYQVSMMIPFGQDQEDLATGRQTTINNPTSVGIMGNYGAIDFSTPAEYYMDYQPAGEVVFGLYQSLKGGTTPGPASGKNAILNYMPSGPIYWANNVDQLNDSPGFSGEPVVGKRYNSRTDPGSPDVYPHHYWPDLNKILSQSPKFEDFREFPNVELNIPPFMKLQDGANTFYQFNTDHAIWSTQEYNSGGGENPSPSKDFGSGFWQPSFGPNTERNVLDYLFYLGGIDNTTKLGSVTNLQKFFVQSLANTGDRNSTAQAILNAGDTTQPDQGWDGPNDYGNGMPGGRYIVVVRATDRNGSAQGEYYEFEVPVYLPWWSTRNNCPLLAYKD